MRAIRKTDDEWASDTSEMMEEEGRWVSWRKPLVVGMCAALLIAAMVVFKRMPDVPQDELMDGFGDMAQDELIDLAAAGDCVDDVSNCMESKCCKFENRKCYMKNQYWATCNDTCDKTHQDQWDKDNNITDGWACTELKKGVCAKDHEDCNAATGKSGCCSADHVCYKKNEHWWNCNKDCQTGAGENDFDSGHPNDKWSCEIQELETLKAPTCTSLNESSTTRDLLQCCVDALCDGDEEKADCKTKSCAFYFQNAENTTGDATTGATTTEENTTTDGANTTDDNTTGN